MIRRPKAMISAPASWWGAQRLAEHEDAKSRGGDRNQQRHQHDVGGSRRGADAEKDDVGERRREQRKADHGAGAGRSGHRQQPEAIDEGGERQQHRGGTDKLSSRGHDGRDRPQAAHPECRQAVRQRRTENGCHADQAGHVGIGHLRPHEDGNAGDAEHDADDLVGGQRLPGQQPHDDQREQRRGGVEHGGEPAGDVRLAIGDQRERDHVVEDGLDDEQPPYRERVRQSIAEERHECQQGECRDPDTGEDQRQRRHFGDCDTNKKERAAPKDRKKGEQDPVDGAHRGMPFGAVARVR
jgi:hypothetical protein